MLCSPPPGGQCRTTWCLRPQRRARYRLARVFVEQGSLRRPADAGPRRGRHHSKPRKKGCRSPAWAQQTASTGPTGSPLAGAERSRRFFDESDRRGNPVARPAMWSCAHACSSLSIRWKSCQLGRLKLTCCARGCASCCRCSTSGMRDCQIEAVSRLEQSLAQDKPRALIQMATGAARPTPPAPSPTASSSTPMRAACCFVVDRDNLGKQTKGEFDRYNLPDTNRKFTETYNIQRLQSSHFDWTDSNRVTITHHSAALLAAARRRTAGRCR